MNTGFDGFRIAMLIKEVYSKTMHIISEGLKESGLTHQQIMVIKLIAHNKEMTISDLCAEMSLSKATVSGIVQRLENMGYIEKVKYDSDKRNTYVKFSEMGLEFAKEFRVTINESFEKMFKNCSQPELKEMTESLQKILKTINSVGD